MDATRRLLAALGVAVLAAWATALPAAADTVVVADPTARNLSSFDLTSAWSRRAADGSHRLVVMGGDGVAADAPVPAMSVPFDPDVGPTKRNGRAIVYSRCAGGSARRGCDVYRYDVQTRVERRLANVSAAKTSEIGPSYFEGAIAFARDGKRAGLYIARKGLGARRVEPGSFDETDMSMVRVIARGRRGTSTFVRVSRFDGSLRQARTARGGGDAPSKLTSPVLAFYRAYWLRRASDRSVVETVSVRSAGSVVDEVDRPFAVGVDAIGLGVYRMPGLYSGPAGVTRIDPLLVFKP